MEISAIGKWKSSGTVPVATNISATDSVTVVCPLVRDNTLNSTGLVSLKVYYTAPTGGSVTCQPYSVGTNGLNAGPSIPSKPGAPTSTPLFLLWHMDTATDNLKVSVSGGSYYVRCVVTPNAKIFALRYEEN